VIEATACGVPVLASNTTSLPGVVNDAGMLINPYNIDELREGMIKLPDDEKIRIEMLNRGLERAKYFYGKNVPKKP